MTIWNGAILVTAAAALVLLIKLAAGNKITPKGHMLLWLLLAVQFIAVPLASVMPESALSIKNYLPQMEETQTDMSSLPDNREQYPVRGTWSEETEHAFGTEGYRQTVRMEVPFTAQRLEKSYYVSDNKRNEEGVFLKALWAAGALIAAGIFLVSVRKQRKRICNLPVCDDVRLNHMLTELMQEIGLEKKVSVQIRCGTENTFLTHLPGVYVICLEDGFDEQESRQVLAHELTHLVHGDLRLNLLAALTLAVFWWNPVMWLAFRRFRRDMEIYCDYDAARLTSDKKSYARTLVHAATGTDKFILGTTSLIGGEKEVNARVKALAAFKKPKTWIAVIAAVALGIACICFALNPNSNGGACAKYFSEIKGENIQQVTAGKQTAGGNVYSYRSIDDGDELKKIADILSSMDKKAFTKSEAVPASAEQPYRISIDFENGDVLQLSGSGKDDLYEIVCEHQETAGETTTGTVKLSGCRLHAPELTAYIRSALSGEQNLAMFVTDMRRDSITLAIRNLDFDLNKEDRELSYDHTYTLEHLTAGTEEDGTWETVTPISDPKNQDGQTVTVKDTSPVTEVIDLTKQYGSLEDGVYRIGKKIAQRRKDTVTEAQNYAVFHLYDYKLRLESWDFLLAQPDGTLNQETIDKLQTLFCESVVHGASNSIKVNPNTLNCYVTSLYSSPEEMDLYELLRYYPSFPEAFEWTQEQEQKLLKSKLWNKTFDGFTMSTVSVPIRLFDPQLLNKGMEYYTGIRVEDISKGSSKCYVPEIDRYMVYSSDYGPGVFQPISGVKQNGEVVLRSAASGEGKASVLTLKEQDGRYLIQSHLLE